MKILPLKNKYITWLIVIVGIPILSFLMSLLFALLKTLSFFTVISSLSFFFGFLLLVGNLIYYFVFNGNQKKIEKTLISPPINNCLICNAKIKTEETRITNLLGIPNSDINIECPICFTRIKSHYPFTDWLIEEVNQKRNPDFAWLYAGEMLKTAELISVSNGHHTAKAITKIRAKELGKISNGDFEALENLYSDGLILHAPNVDTYIYPKINISKNLFALQKDELFIIASNNIVLQKVTSRNNIATQTDVDKGNLVITNKRIAYFGQSKQITKRLADIQDIRQKKYNLHVYFKGRKTPEIFVNLDEALFASVLEGTTRKA